MIGTLQSLLTLTKYHVHHDSITSVLSVLINLYSGCAYIYIFIYLSEQNKCNLGSHQGSISSYHKDHHQTTRNVWNLNRGGALTVPKVTRQTP